MTDDLQLLITRTGARVTNRFPFWLRPFLFRGVAAITFGRRIYLAEDSEQLLRHELAHVQQIARLGMARFYWRYLTEYISLRRRGHSPADAYQRISFEVEAFDAEKHL